MYPTKGVKEAYALCQKWCFDCVTGEHNENGNRFNIITQGRSLGVTLDFLFPPPRVQRSLRPVNPHQLRADPSCLVWTTAHCTPQSVELWPILSTPVSQHLECSNVYGGSTDIC